MKNNETISIGKTIGKMVLLAMMSVLLAAALAGLIVTKELLRPEAGKTIMPALQALVVFVVSCLAARKAPHGKMIAALTTALLIVTLQLLFKSIVFSETQMAVDWRMIITAAVSVLAGIIGSQKKSRRR